jgi:hypothetical protein
MLKKLGLLLLAVSFSAIFCASLFAQAQTPPITSDDVDLYIKLGMEPDITKRAALINQAYGDPLNVGINQSKIATVAYVVLNGQLDEAAIKARLNQSPMTAITDQELKIIFDKLPGVLEAYPGNAGLRTQ